MTAVNDTGSALRRETHTKKEKEKNIKNKSSPVPKIYL